LFAAIVLLFLGCWQAGFPAIFVQQLSLAGAAVFDIPKNEDRNKMQNAKSSDKSFICLNNIIYFEICGHDLNYPQQEVPCCINGHFTEPWPQKSIAEFEYPA
jgi:hypothetical protein